MKDISPTSVRLPTSLRDTLKRKAKEGSRSLHAEILLRLENSLQNEPISNKQFMAEIDLKEPQNLEILRTVVKEVIAKEKEKRAENK